MEFQSKKGREWQGQNLLLKFSCQVCPGQQWAINMEVMVVELPVVGAALILAKLTWVRGWSNEKLWKAWRDIVTLMVTSIRKEGLAPILARKKTMIQWWQVPTSTPSLEEERRTMWKMMKMIGWNLRGKVMPLNPLVDCPSPYH